MIHENIELTGSFIVSGSFVLPSHPNTGSVTALTGSVYHDTTDNILKVYTGNAWVTVGEQTASTPPPPADTTPDIEYLVVAGGGGSAYDGGGGGGAGGLLSSSIADVESGSVMTITVGAGGNVASNGTDSSLASTAGTSFSTITSIGGGTGAGAGNSYTAGSGGSGGGGAGGQYNNPGGSGTVGQGNDGGTSGTSGGGTTYPGSGGGGAGEAGGEGVNSGGAGKPGGVGKQTNITGTATYFAGGGGGASGGGGGGAGGSGGGGAGGNSAQGTAGTVNTGGGAGGSNITSGVTGGSGVVILAYPTGSATGQGGIKTTRSDGHFVHTFNESGTFTLGGPDFHTIAPTENFNTLLHVGNGTSQSITGVRFKPDLVITKGRFAAQAAVHDVVRGAGYYLSPYITNASTFYSTVLTSFDSDGFSVGNNSGLNSNTQNYVNWCWKAGGSSASNTDGTITSTVSANQDAGFSIVKYTSTGTNGSTIGHGLNSAPDLVIIKSTTNSTNWIVYNSESGTGKYMYLNSSAEDQSSSWFGTSATTFTLNNTFSDANTSGRDYIAYCFHSVEGYQKIGGYTGAGSSGLTVTTGFKPKWIMIKRTDSANDWVIIDSVRDTSDPHSQIVWLNTIDAEADGGATTAVSFTDTGFSMSTSAIGGSINASGGTYIYYAISE